MDLGKVRIHLLFQGEIKEHIEVPDLVSGSTSNLLAHHSSSAHQPAGSTMAPCYLAPPGTVILMASPGLLTPPALPWSVHFLLH